jgi:hypothetical protein
MRTGVSGAGKAPRVCVVGPLLDEFNEEIARRVLETGRLPNERKITVLPWTARENGIIRRVDAGFLRRAIR